MEKDELKELYYISPFENVVSICRIGIVSYNLATKIQHKSVAMQEIQERRRRKILPSGRWLHDYVNLYICVRNPMLYKLQCDSQKLCIFSVSIKVLDIKGTMISDRNASCDGARFSPAPDGLANINRDLIFAESWNHQDYTEKKIRKSIKCAEVLVPDCVRPEYLQWIYVKNKQEMYELTRIIRGYGIVLPIKIGQNLFFVIGEKET
jgi:hypothetical protein